MYSGGHLERSKRPDKTFVSHFIPLRCWAWETPSMSGKGWKIFYEFLHLTFYNYCWIEIMLLILVYWRKLCYSICNPFYVILLHIFMWYCSSWEMVEPMSINSHVMKQSAGHWLVWSNYRGVLLFNHCNPWTKGSFCLILYFEADFLKRFSPCFCTGEHFALYWLGKNEIKRQIWHSTSSIHCLNNFRRCP